MKKLSSFVDAGHLDFALQSTLNDSVIDVLSSQWRATWAAVQLPEGG